MAFHIGQKVVCVRAADLVGNHNYSPILVEGVVYTIRGASTEGCDTVWLEEIIGKESSNKSGEIGIWAKRFRPAVNISTFTEILDDVKQRKPETVE